MRYLEHNQISCLACNGLFDFARPLDGDFDNNLHDAYSICTYCGEVGVFVVHNDQLSLRQPSLKELHLFNERYGPFVREFHDWRAQNNFFQESPES